MKKNRIVAIVVIVSLVGVFIGAAGSGLIREIKAELREDFTIVIDGEKKVFKNADGEKVYPILYDGTTYLPIRAIGELMGKKVYWYEDDKLIEFKPSQAATVTDADVIVGDTYSDKSDFIGAENAKKIALKRAGLSSSEVIFIRAELDNDDGVWHYDVEFRKDNVSYDGDVNAIDGKILGWDIEKEDDDKNISAEQLSPADNIGQDKAKKIALNKAGISENEVTFIKAELEKDDGILKYEVEFTKDKIEYEAEINAIDGTIINWSVDRED